MVIVVLIFFIVFSGIYGFICVVGQFWQSDCIFGINSCFYIYCEVVEYICFRIVVDEEIIDMVENIIEIM